MLNSFCTETVDQWFVLLQYYVENSLYSISISPSTGDKKKKILLSTSHKYEQLVQIESIPPPPHPPPHPPPPPPMTIQMWLIDLLFIE